MIPMSGSGPKPCGSAMQAIRSYMSGRCGTKSRQGSRSSDAPKVLKAGSAVRETAQDAERYYACDCGGCQTGLCSLSSSCALETVLHTGAPGRYQGDEEHDPRLDCRR